MALLGAAPIACADDGPSGPGNGADGLDLRIPAAYVVQSTQTREGAVPLVADRAGWLRVFVTASQSNDAAPRVRVRLFHGSTLRETFMIAADGPGVPTDVDQASRASSWDVQLPGALIRPGLRLEITVDPEDEIAESNEANNGFPAGGGALDPIVGELPVLRIRFVPIHQLENGLTGRVDASNTDEFLEFTLDVHPVPGADADVRAPLTVDGLGFDPQGNTWQVALSELNAVRVAEGSDRYYYGVVQTEYPGGGVVGIGLIGGKAALGWDRFPDADETVAHELGHNWGRRHAPCGGAGGADPQYPYPLGLIGVFGIDVETGEIKAPADYTDIMGYCDTSFWISDYTYAGVYAHRAAQPGTATARHRSLLVWGRVVDGVPVLEPAFTLTTRSAPPRGSEFTLEGLDVDGGLLFTTPFSAEHAAHPAARATPSRDHGVFAFTLPVDEPTTQRLHTLRVRAGGETLEEVRAATGVAAIEPRTDVRLVGHDRIRIDWEASRYPAALVRDAQTGAVLSIGRHGRTVVSGVTRLEILFSDGVRTAGREW